MKFDAIFFGLAALAASVAALNEYDNPYEVAPCTITLRRLVQFKNLGTSTVYLKSHTATRYIDCHGCAMTTKRMGAHGPAQHATATVTSPVTTTTMTICSPNIK